MPLFLWLFRRAVFLDNAIGGIEAQFTGLGEIAHAFSLTVEADEAEPPVIVGFGHAWLMEDGSAIVVDGALVVAVAGIEGAAVV